MRKAIIATILVAAVAGLVAVAIFALVPAQPLPPPEAIAICHVSVVDVVNGGIEKDVTVLLVGGEIQAVGESVAIGQAQVVDGAGKFLIPGLWDMHVHSCNASDHFFPLFLANGVTGIRDMFAPSLEDLKTTRAQVENGTLLGPRMVFSGPIVDGPKPMWPGSIGVADAAEGRKAVDKLQQGGADFVKVYSFLPREAYFAIADEAKKRGMVFCGHVPDTIKASEASDAGQKSFEHLISVLAGCSSNELETLATKGWTQRMRTTLHSYDPAKAQALFAQFRRNGTWQCPTLTVLRAMSHLDEPAFRNDPRLAYFASSWREQWNPTNDFRFQKMTHDDWEVSRQKFAEDCKLVGRMEKAGVAILAGTDTPNPYCFPGMGIHDELALLTGCGLTPLQALQTATINPARYFGWEKQMGSVEAGKAADLVLLDANPLDDIHNTTKITAVLVRGRYLNRAALDHLLAKESEAACLRTRPTVGMELGD